MLNAKSIPEARKIKKLHSFNCWTTPVDKGLLEKAGPPIGVVFGVPSKKKDQTEICTVEK